MADTGLRVGVYVDAENLSRNGGDRMQYRVLRNIACRENGQAIRLNTYIAFDERRAQADPPYRESMLEYYSAVRDAGFKIIEKKVQHSPTTAASSAARPMPISTWRSTACSSPSTSTASCSGPATATSSRSCARCRTAGAASRSSRSTMSLETCGARPITSSPATSFPASFLRPLGGKPWGQPGFARARRLLLLPAQGKEVGFLRYLDRSDGNLWLRDERDENSPYSAAAFHVNNMPAGFDASVASEPRDRLRIRARNG